MVLKVVLNRETTMKKILLSAIVSAMTALPLCGADTPPPTPIESTQPHPGSPPALPPPPNKTERLKHILLVRDLLLVKYDLNKDGKLDAAEKATLLRDADDEKKRAREAFLKRYDRDGDGKLSHEERKAMNEEMKKRGKRFFHVKRIPPPRSRESHQPPPPGMMMENKKRERFSIRPSVFMLSQSILIKKYDANGNGVIDPAEFEKIREEAARLYSDRTQNLLSKYDKNGDGILSPEEKATIPGKPALDETASDQSEALDDIDLFIQESFDTELLESLEEAETDSESDADTGKP